MERTAGAVAAADWEAAPDGFEFSVVTDMVRRRFAADVPAAVMSEAVSLVLPT